jgi:uncharacterized delta-60 repeat protein
MSAARWACAACLMAVALTLVAASAADTATLRLDARFGEGGIARAPFKWQGWSRELFGGTLRPARQADGKVLVAAQPDADHGLANEIVLARFGRAGAPDRSFGRRGLLRIAFPWQFQPLKVLAQRDGRIVLVGTVGGYAYFSAVPSQLGIVRLLPDGSRDRSFGTNGVVVWNPPWRAANEWTTPGLVVRQSEGRLLVAGTVEDPRLRGSPGGPGQRVVLVRFLPDGSLDQSFGPGGFAELDWDDAYFGGWARLADGRLASVVFRHEGPGTPTRESTAWWLHTFTADGSPAAPRSSGSVRLGLNLLDQLVDLVPTRDGGLLMIGDRDPSPAVRRIFPDGSLDATFRRKCAQPPLPVGSPRGGASTPDGGVLVTTGGSFAIPYDATGCIAARPLRLRGFLVGPPLLQRGRSALVGASFNNNEGLAAGLALIKIRR